MANPMTKRIDNIVKRGASYAKDMTVLLPEMIDHIIQHRDTSSTSDRLLNGVDDKDARIIARIIRLCVNDDSLTVKFNKKAMKWTTTIRKEKDGGLDINGNKMGVLRALGEEGVSFRSDRIVAELSDEPEESDDTYDFAKSMLTLVKKAHKKANATDAALVAAFKAALEADKENAPGDVVADVSATGDNVKAHAPENVADAA